MAVRTLFKEVSCCPAEVMVWTLRFELKGQGSRCLPLWAWSSRPGRTRSLCRWCCLSSSHTLRPQGTPRGYSSSDFCLPRPDRSNTPQSSRDSYMLKEKGSVSKYFPTGDAPLLIPTVVLKRVIQHFIFGPGYIVTKSTSKHSFTTSFVKGNEVPLQQPKILYVGFLLH